MGVIRLSAAMTNVGRLALRHLTGDYFISIFKGVAAI
jgi:hypothetical protein